MNFTQVNNIFYRFVKGHDKSLADVDFLVYCIRHVITFVWTNYFRN